MMERDARRGGGQWRGCYSFKDIVCDNNKEIRTRRTGGLKMGHTYYYYYELDGSFETHDPNLPSTTNCPYLPGQTVNTLEVPTEHSLRKRSASLNSLRSANFRTMNPEDKFITPRAPPPAPYEPSTRPSSLPLSDDSPSSSRSTSPATAWRRFFRKRSPSRGSDSSGSLRHEDRTTSPQLHVDDSNSTAELQRENNRDISPDSLRRFLADDASAPSTTASIEARPFISIPEDIAEENEDDENFATSASSENNPYATCLSPPPFKRYHSDGSVPTVTNGSQMTLTQCVISTSGDADRVDLRHGTDGEADKEAPECRSLSSASSVISSTDPLSYDEAPSFYDSNDDDDVLSSNDGEVYGFQPLSLPSTRKHSLEQSNTPFSGYSLPQSIEGNKMALKPSMDQKVIGSPQFIARSDSDIPVGDTALLAAPSDHGIDDFVSEMTWMVDVIRGKDRSA